MGTVDGENLELIALDVANPTRSTVCFSVRDSLDRIFKTSEASLSLRKVVEFAKRYPLLVLSAMSAKDRREQVTYHRRGQNRDRYSIHE